MKMTAVLFCVPVSVFFVIFALQYQVPKPTFSPVEWVAPPGIPGGYDLQINGMQEWSWARVELFCGQFVTVRSTERFENREEARKAAWQDAREDYHNRLCNEWR